jgi:predicted secreted Zn-dependent protease
MSYAEPVVSVKTTYYKVTGSTPNAIRKDMNKKRSGKYDAYTNWNVTWRFNTAKNKNKDCEIKDIKVALDIKFILPQWKADRSVGDDLKEHWNNYYTALIDHENQHKDIAIEMAHEIEEVLNELGATKDCNYLKKTANDTANKVLKDYKRKQNDFDKDTNHGINDGAVFP